MKNSDHKFISWRNICLNMDLLKYNVKMRFCLQRSKIFHNILMIQILEEEGQNQRMQGVEDTACDLFF